MGKGDCKTIAFLTLGCKLNYAETSTYERGFREAGFDVVPWGAGADVYLVNTCSVTSVADAKSRNLVRKVLRVNPEAVVVVTGCSAQLRRADYEAIPGVARVFGCDEKARVVPETVSLVQNRKTVCPATAADVFPAWSSGERTRSFLKVQDGCDNFCAYCTVPYARGRSRNVPVAECVRNAGEAAALGVKEIVLTGVNTGDFGRSTGETFLELLQALNAVEGIERYRISSIEPNLLTDEIIDWIASGTKFQPHFHIPLQTGTDEQLAAMGRKYTTEFFAGRVDYVRKALEGPGKPLVFFGIDVMVGLPGETPEQFARTLGFLRDRVRPAFIHVFPYSRRPGTPAASMPGQVCEAVKKERVAALEELCSQLHSEFGQANRGVRERVLWESTDHGGFMEGYTGNYIRVRKPWEPSLCGKITEVTI
ncbi:MAG: MiaB/RimO family radical SAM methylthiotransferase [Bacteroidales bacterium]|nr:MiaB/RimO family radical SAM methylthiotransferase [Bacteroidales bacterium]